MLQSQVVLKGLPYLVCTYTSLLWVPSIPSLNKSSDPTGVLEEGEIYFRGTEQWQDTTGMWCDILVGYVLVCCLSLVVLKLSAIETLPPGNSASMQGEVISIL